MRVVVVDNDRALVRSLTIVLANQGHQVESFVDSRKAAVALGRTVVPEVLVLDYMMPGLDAIGLLKRVRGRLPVGCRVVLISGHTECWEDERLDRLGLSARLPKPIDLDALSRLIRGDDELPREACDEVS